MDLLMRGVGDLGNLFETANPSRNNLLLAMFT